MARLRADIWCAAFVRRHNDMGHICVVSRKGDAIAGQIFIEVDHLNGKSSLFTPAYATSGDRDNERLFQQRFNRVESNEVAARIAREADFDPDLWVITLEMRDGETGIPLADEE